MFANLLFPHGELVLWPLLPLVCETSLASEFTVKELGLATKKHLLSKAPGSDGITNYILRMFVMINPVTLLELLYVRLRLRKFPLSLKEA